MHVDVPGLPGERPEVTVLVAPVPKLPVHPHEGRAVKGLSGEVGRAHLDVDDGLGCRAGHRGRADVLNPLSNIAQLRRKPRLPSGVAARPGLVVGHHRWRVIGPVGTHRCLNRRREIASPGFPSAMSQERGRRRHICMREHDEEAVVVIGAGLAGLTAAATAARARRPVVVVEAHTSGGRARTDELSGYRFNQGPHALGRGGEAWRILHDLGVPHRGHRPPLRGARVVRDGKLVGVPIGQLGLLIPRLLTVSAASWAGRSAEEWVESLGGSRDLPDLARMLIRVTTYVTDLGRMPADFAISRIKAARRGVSYLDEGFASLVEGISSAASAAGATIRTHQAAAGINAVPGGWEVELAGGEVLPAAAVVIAAGSPAAARKLLPVDPGWPELGPPVTAACLDLGLRGPHPSVVIGVDEPLYLACHCPPGALAPAGGSVVHVMRYGARDAGLDRAELHRFATLAGITNDQIVAERFLAVHVVTYVLPGPEDGLAGRPAVAVPRSPGLYLAGDWVGPSGWLSDAAMASGQHAGLLAAGAPAEDRTYPRVA
jgi:phytoene dehydrogenase-like protein